ncbi:AbrB/MazE/SpoVT family DNA-binding domain-containing protein [Candidatus Woesearchaeota archaeon]|nr:AbrB/MazE/SpoVT family DNA-binding domain-containing protein [Candidatus Woesearchaeota archaeon]
MAIEVEVKKWGNSLGIVLPKEFVLDKGIHAEQKILIEVTPRLDISRLFGRLKLKRKMTGQEFKDMVREGWN